MVWFQCEDCGENLKKPKLVAHFRQCSARKLSCIDCGVIFNQQSVQAHTQCVSEAEKYGPKNNGSMSAKFTNTSTDGIDICIGLSTSAPWNCSLCNVKATSQESLALHAQGKKHKSKAKAASAKQLNARRNESPKKSTGENGNLQSLTLPEDKSYTFEVPNHQLEGQGVDQDRKLGAATPEHKCLITEIDVKRKRQHTEHNENCKINSLQPSLQQEEKTGQSNEQDYKKRRKSPVEKGSMTKESREELGNKNACTPIENGRGGQKMEEGNGFLLDPSSSAKAACSNSSLSMAVKWKKIIKRTLRKSDSGCLRKKELFKAILPVVLNKLESAGMSASKDTVRVELENQICSSSTFIVDGKVVRLSCFTKAE